jgi:hypothetical protein
VVGAGVWGGGSGHKLDFRGARAVP